MHAAVALQATAAVPCIQEVVGQGAACPSGAGRARLKCERGGTGGMVGSDGGQAARRPPYPAQRQRREGGMHASDRLSKFDGWRRLAREGGVSRGVSLLCAGTLQGGIALCLCAFCLLLVLLHLLSSCSHARQRQVSCSWEVRGEVAGILLLLLLFHPPHKL
jgi:hypothetical protein